MQQPRSDGSERQIEELRREHDRLQLLVERLQLEGAQARERARLYEAEREARLRAEELAREAEESRRTLKTMQRAAERDAAELEAIVDALPVGLVIYDREGGIRRINRIAQESLGYMRGEWGLSMEQRADLILPETAEGRPLRLEDTPIARALRGETARDVIMVFRRPDGPKAWISDNAAPILDAEGNPVGAVIAFMDITRLHEMEEQRADLLRAVSHDLRSPLAAIHGQTQLLLRSLDKPGMEERNRRSLEAILTGARRMNAIIQDLVDAVRLEAGQLRVDLRPVDLEALLAEYLERVGHVLAVSRVRIEVPEGLPPVEADPGRLERVLTNLLSNALKYSDPETQVVVRVEPAEGEVQLSVEDRGQGISPEHLPHIFERFYRAGETHKTDGLGLGLFISRMLVQAQGGRLWARSAVGEGSTFSFTLPVAGEP